MIKNYVLDTNVILHDCQSIYQFADNHVIVPITVLGEIDKFKKEMNETGRNARHFSKMLDALRAEGSLVEGVALGEGTIRVCECPTEPILPVEMDTKTGEDRMDNRILATALQLSRDSEFPTTLVTQDTNLRIKADILGIKAEAYENGRVDFESLYAGISSHLYIPDTEGLAPNEYVRILASDGSTESKARYDLGVGELVPLREDLKAWDLVPRNEEQEFAMDLLLNDDIKIVTLVGKAGTGKTLLAIAAGLQKVTDEFVYRKLLVSRPVFPMGKDIGFLPGEIEDKLAPYMQPIYDNVEYLMSGYKTTKVKMVKPYSQMTKAEKAVFDAQREKEEGVMGKGHMELVAAGIMGIEPLLYIRGRSIPDQYMIIDEAQNLTPHEVKTIVTRAGTGTKFVFTGDPQQIDNPYVDASSNGLTYLVERFKNEKIAGHVVLTQGERSELAEIASNVL